VALPDGAPVKLSRHPAQNTPLQTTQEAITAMHQKLQNATQPPIESHPHWR